jgi:hypothetical protein
MTTIRACPGPHGARIPRTGGGPHHRGGIPRGRARDVGNTPMAAAFARCGYVVVDRLMVHV